MPGPMPGPSGYSSGASYTSCDAIVARPDVQSCLQVGNSLFFVIRQNFPFNAACQACQSIGGGSLAMIKNFQQYSALVSFASIPAAGTLWIGASSLQSPGNFCWIDNSPMSYNMWLPGYPVNAPGCNCVLATSSSQMSTANQPPFIGWTNNDVGWGNTDCNFPSFPLCQINLGGGSFMG